MFQDRTILNFLFPLIRYIVKSLSIVAIEEQPRVSDKDTRQESAKSMSKSRYFEVNSFIL